MVNSLLSSGEVPGLYTAEELEPLLSSLKDAASQDGFTRPLYDYFSYKCGVFVRCHMSSDLHISCACLIYHMLIWFVSAGRRVQNASDQKTEMEKIKEKMAQEVSKIGERKAKIDDELKEVQPLVDEAKRAVGNIKPEALSEIRSLRMPPDVIRDILEGVLRLMGVFDTTWVSMKR
ncbi:hypothetical protein GOODEAATRI_014183 [Goodea atripinnis]|uniref:DOG1 domain-containing protein n=1 Tax=Goodea atripinnis TaxID=208336 RepID=A0ABV0NBZ9_9TELE